MKQLEGTKLVVVTLFVMALLFVASSKVAMAQVSGSMSGRIEDPSGARSLARM